MNTTFGSQLWKGLPVEQLIHCELVTPSLLKTDVIFIFFLNLFWNKTPLSFLGYSIKPHLPLLMIHSLVYTVCYGTPELCMSHTQIDCYTVPTLWLIVPCTALMAGTLPAVRAVQGDCERVYIMHRPPSQPLSLHPMTPSTYDESRGHLWCCNTLLMSLIYPIYGNA